MSEKLTPEILGLYGFQRAEPSSGQGDSYQKNGFVVTRIEEFDEWVYGAGFAKRDVSTVENLKLEWQEKMNGELIMEL